MNSPFITGGIGGDQVVHFDSVTVTATNFDNGGGITGFATQDVLLQSSGAAICFRGDTQVKTSDGYKNIENLKRGDMVMTNAGAQPLAKLSKGLPTPMIKIPKDLLAKNVPNRDVVVCPCIHFL